MQLNILKITTLSVVMLLGIGMMLTPQTAVAEPTLKQTMSWLTDYVVRESGCTYRSTTISISGASYDAQGQYLIVKEERRVAGKQADGTVTKRIPLYAIEKVTLSEKGDEDCSLVTIVAQESSIKIDDEDGVTYLGRASIRFFRTDDAAKRVAKAVRHAGSLAVKPHRSELF